MKQEFRYHLRIDNEQNHMLFLMNEKPPYRVCGIPVNHPDNHIGALKQDTK